jgi:very-short-patch-repair endonuclease
MPPDPDRLIADRSEIQDGVFSIADAREVGFSERQIDCRVGNEWSVIYDGVYRMGGAPPTWHSGLRAAALAAGEGAAISRRSAAAMYELPAARRDLIELTCIRWSRTTKASLVVHESRRLDSRDVQLIDGIPVTTPERTLLDLASQFPHANYLEYIAQAARRKRLLTYESTKLMFDRNARRGLKGVRALRELLERWDPDSMPTESEMETMLVQALRRHGLPEPVVQHVVTDERGAFVARTDAAYPAFHIAIEYDSAQEHSDEFQISRDAARRNRLQAAGYALLSARHQDLRVGATSLCDQIAAIMRRASEPA